ncbi:MAG: aspartate--tRNA ligase [Bacteroidetes bacterium]|nr:aspartate--tRNA ligase [Bacteroidota bacterium]
MTFTKRTHTCGELRAEDIGQPVTMNGWVDGRRDLGGMIFVDLRDRYGLTQVVFAPQHNSAVHEKAHELRSEFVLSVTGVVQPRPEGMTNTDMPTGEIEVVVDSFEVLTRAEIPPFEIEDEVDAHEDLRLTYRYLDLRRPVLQRNLLLRHQVYQVTHRYFDEHDFIEIETPVLTKSTPEGARDYLVPSRVHPGRFFALPQSPQTYKQLLMVAGFDRYMQIVKCFRDEDLRADRQPEFTQIDLEMSFVTSEDVFEIMEGFIQRLLAKTLDVTLSLPVSRMDYFEALERYGSDKPDLRFGMELVTLNDVLAGTDFKVFASVLEAGGIVSAIKVDGRADEFSRKKLDELTERARALGLGGLAWMKATDGSFQSPIAKFLSADQLHGIRSAMQAEDGDLVLIAAHEQRTRALVALGTIRLELGRSLGLIDASAHSLLWVTDFPLFQWDEEEGRYYAEHHPFTSPKSRDLHLLDSDPAAARADCYDLVWNGNEVGSGSIRIHDSALQAKVFSILGLSEQEIEEKFGFLINAFRYGAPPHGGIALGLDRIVTILAGLPSIRDVIAFPKTNSALSLMDGCPSAASEAQLKELRLELKGRSEELKVKSEE